MLQERVYALMLMFSPRFLMSLDGIIDKEPALVYGLAALDMQTS